MQALDVSQEYAVLFRLACMHRTMATSSNRPGAKGLEAPADGDARSAEQIGTTDVGSSLPADGTLRLPAPTSSGCTLQCHVLQAEGAKVDA